MADTGQVDSAYLNNAHVMGFTISGVNLTGRVVKLALSLINPRSGRFDPKEAALVKTTETPADFQLIDGPTGQIDFLINPEDTDPLTTRIGANAYQFQVEVFDGAGENGVVVSEGVLTFSRNIAEAA